MLGMEDMTVFSSDQSEMSVSQSRHAGMSLSLSSNPESVKSEQREPARLGSTTRKEVTAKRQRRSGVGSASMGNHNRGAPYQHQLQVQLPELLDAYVLRPSTLPTEIMTQIIQLAI